MASSLRVWIVVLWSLNHVRLFATPWAGARQASLLFINSQSLLQLMSIESVMPSNHLILCCPFSSCLQSFPSSGSFPMSLFFASGAQSIGVSASTSVEFKGDQLDQLDLLAVQGTLKSFLQHHSSKASILLDSAFFLMCIKYTYIFTHTHIYIGAYIHTQLVSNQPKKKKKRLSDLTLPKRKHNRQMCWRDHVTTLEMKKQL